MSKRRLWEQYGHAVSFRTLPYVQWLKENGLEPWYTFNE